MKKIGFIFTGGRKNIMPLIEEGKAPSDFFYGALELKKRGYLVDIIEDEDIPKINFGKFTDYFFKKLFHIIGVNIILILRLNKPPILQRLNSLDVIVATTNSYGLSLAVLKFTGRLKVKVVFIAMGVFLLKSNFIRKFIYKKLLKNLIITPLSKNETSFLQKEFPNIKNKIIYLPFGVDPGFWTPSTFSEEDNSKYVLSIGNDINRDYLTLIRAWKPEYPLLKIITRMKIKEKLPPNVEIVNDIEWEAPVLSDTDIRKLTQECFCVIVPLGETIQPSGQSACLRSMSCGKVVIMSKISGLWDGELMEHGYNCLLTKLYSKQDIRDKLESLLNDENFAKKIGTSAGETVVKHFTINCLTDKLEEIIGSL